MFGRLLALALAVAVGLGACSKASEESEARRSPVPPPPPDVTVPASLRIDVTVDGAAADAITAERLRALAPDFHDAERRAWRLARVVPAFDQPGATIEARGAEGVSIRVRRPDAAAQPEPVLFLTRRGDVIVAVVDPANPFPNYHGQGGQLRRGADPLPRLAKVVGLDVDTTP